MAAERAWRSGVVSVTPLSPQDGGSLGVLVALEGGVGCAGVDRVAASGRLDFAAGGGAGGADRAPCAGACVVVARPRATLRAARAAQRGAPVCWSAQLEVLKIAASEVGLSPVASATTPGGLRHWGLALHAWPRGDDHALSVTLVASRRPEPAVSLLVRLGDAREGLGG